MPKVHKRAVGSRHYHDYTEETLNKCLSDIKNKVMTQRDAAKAYNIPRRTINYKLKEKHTKSFGRPKAFSGEEEKSFVDHIIKMSEFGFPVNKTDLRHILKSYLDRIGRKIKVFKNNLPGLTWVSLFFKRNPTLSVRLATNIKRSRAAVNKEMLEDYINNLKKVVADVPPHNIYNYDETNLTDNPGQKKILTKRGSKYPEKICNSSKVTVSIMMCGNAAGDLIPPYVVYKAKNLWQPWTENGPKGCRYNATPSGWFDSNTFTGWFDKSLVRHLRKTPGKKVVIGDNLSSHLSPYVIDKCKEENIYFVCLPPNSTHITQPLDVAFFHPMKVAWRKILTDWKNTPEGLHNTTLQKQSFPKLLKQLLDVLQPTIKTTMQNGFRKCGIYPCVAAELLERLPRSEDVNSSVEQSFIEHLNIKRSEVTQNVRKPRKKLKVAPGTSYAHSRDSSDDNSDFEGNEDQEKVDNMDDKDSTSEIDEPIECPVSKTYSVDDFVIFKYIETLYPGLIISTTEEGAIIQSMEKSKTFYRWPVKPDELFYDWKDVIMKINAPKLIRTGYFKVKELETYSE